MLMVSSFSDSKPSDGLMGGANGSNVSSARSLTSVTEQDSNIISNNITANNSNGSSLNISNSSSSNNGAGAMDASGLQSRSNGSFVVPITPALTPVLTNAVSYQMKNMLTNITATSPVATPTSVLPELSSGNPGSNYSLITSQRKVSLPPISSFDNLVKAAQNQFSPPNPSMGATPVNTPTPGSFRSNSLPTLDLPHSTKLERSSLQPTPPASATTVKDNKKLRKKKECMICHNFYANLSTHKSTHLTPENRPHKCPICSHGFARNNDLIRHKKRHWKDQITSRSLNSPESSSSEDGTLSDSKDSGLTKYHQLKSLHQIKGTFKCPFNTELIQLDMKVYPEKSSSLFFETSNCHQTGVFSRCDTYKNHLKALHFEYPPGTKKINRPIVAGRCRHCGKSFPNVDHWLKNHIGKECGYTYH